MKLRALVVAGVVSLGALAGCATPEPPFSAAESMRAAVQWRGPAGALTGRLTFETGAQGDLRLTIRDGIRSDEERLTLTRGRGEWTARGSLVGRPWRGVWNTAPARVAGWLSFAEAIEGVRLAADGEKDVRTGRFSLRYEKRAGRLSGVEVVAVATGDRFRASFDPGG